MATPNESITTPEDWPAKAADTIDAIVSALRDKTVVPLVRIVRAIVYGFLALVVLAIVGVLSAIAGVRILDVYAFGTRVWISYFIIGGIMMLIGLLLWKKRSKR